jgi:hypothetical protein
MKRSFLTSARRFRQLMGAGALVALSGLAGATPAPWAPAGATPVAVGEHFEINGVPMHTHAFVLRRPVDQVAREWRRAMAGTTVSDDQVGARRVLGHVSADHLVTLQLEAVPGGTRGLWSATPLRAALTVDTQRVQREALRPLPAGAALRQSQRSMQTARESLVVLAHHPHSPAVLAEHLKHHFDAEGLKLQGQHEAPGQGAVLMFAAAGRTVTAVLTREATGGTGVAITTEQRHGGTR